VFFVEQNTSQEVIRNKPTNQQFFSGIQIGWTRDHRLLLKSIDPQLVKEDTPFRKDVKFAKKLVSYHFLFCKNEIAIPIFHRISFPFSTAAERVKMFWPPMESWANLHLLVAAT
jgi:hypothetical protein